LAVGVIGLRSRRLRTHEIAAFGLLVWEVVQGFVVLPMLGF
jgi:hypothetical protein